MRIASIGLAVALALLAGGQVQSAPAAKPGAKPALQLTTERAWAAALKVHSSTDACSTSIGMTAAKVVVRYCLYQSSATHPPCDTENSCATITDHIDAQGIAVPGEIVPGESSMAAKEWKTVGSLHAE
jgi:hypothetical protein